MFGVYLAIDSLIVVGLLVLVIFALSGEGIRRRENRMFTGFTLLTAVWIIANHISNDTSQPPSTSVLANYFIFSSSFGAMILIMKLMAQMVGDAKSSKVIRFFEPLLWLTCIIAATPLTTTGVELQDNVYAVTFGPFISVYGILLLSMVAATYIIIRRGLRFQTGAKRAKLKVLNLSLSISLPLIVSMSFLLPSLTGIFAFTEFGVTPILILIGGFYYSIIRHQLFDVRLAVVRAVAYAMSLLTLSIAYFVLAYFVSVFIFENNVNPGVSTSPVNIVMALLLAFIFQPVKQFFDRYTDKLFFRNAYNTQEVYDRLGEVVNGNILLKPLLTKSLDIIHDTLRPSSLHFILMNHTEIGSYISHGKEGKRLPVEVIDILQSMKNPVSVIDVLPDDQEEVKVFAKQDIAIVSKLKTKQGLNGFIIIGDKASGARFTQRDVDLIAVISDELSVAVENSLRYEEIKAFNQTLQAKVDDATEKLQLTNKKLQDLDKSKDEFISMASHQLRTPLTAVKGYVSMLLEGDIGKISTQQREVLEQAYDSSQRMVFLIGDFLNVSRLQTGKFVIEPSTINYTELVDEEVDQLKDTGRARKITLNYHKPETVISGIADENKLRQVMMNFMDNAIFYSPAGTSVDILLYKDADGIVFKVSDHGIGVPKAEQVKLFTKFFRAENARQQRPDGTGIGIYMAKKVIAAHGGSIIFESKEGVGSTFGFKIPLEYDAKKLNNQPDATAKHSGHNS